MGIMLEQRKREIARARTFYIVEYGDERGAQRQTIYGPGTEEIRGEAVDDAVNDALLTIRQTGIDPDTAPYFTAYPDGGTIHTNALTYVNVATPWDSVWEMGEGDNNFSVHGYDSARGNWTVSLTMVKAV